ncbi:SsgA family sporulation/cell division regulator [Streptomyces sp. NRRL S-350]|uniref:SsgA family sporulation/cell division regulator n=1 Tax=Streptomyces sp. NRRL S-350 TaxID=1463902 RepID=UPI0004C13B06
MTSGQVAEFGAFLADGLTSPTGAGDVRIWSDPLAFASHADRRMRLSLDSPQGRAHLTTPWSDIEKFVTASRKVVAPGREPPHVAAAFDDFAASIHLNPAAPATRPAHRP